MDDAIGDTELCVNLPDMLFGAKYRGLSPLYSSTACNVR